MTQPIRRLVLAWLCIAITLAGCAPAGGSVRPLTESELATIVAATSAALQTQIYPTVLAEQLSAMPSVEGTPAPTATPSITPYPTFTPPPSLTPLPTPRVSSQTSTPVGMTGLMATVAAQTAAASGSVTPLPLATGSGTPVPEYACQYIGQTPSDFVVYRPGKDFDVFWTVKNVGSKTWEAANVDLVYLKGAILHRRSAYDLRANVPPGALVPVGFDAIAPDIEGGYNTVWALVLRQGDGRVLQFCQVNFAFDVRRWGEP
ncbi:MAG: NBR1-Ig-like domain-containing protein [Anaerolineales bacterium]